jgi:uncharacterized protein YcfJ
MKSHKGTMIGGVWQHQGGSGNATEMLRMLRNVKGCYVEFFDDEARQEDTEK